MMSKFLAGIMLMFFALSGAAFTAHKTSQSFHYLQKPGECKQIPNTGCAETELQACLRPDPDDNTGPWPVNEVRLNPATCDVPLSEIEP